MFWIIFHKIRTALGFRHFVPVPEFTDQELDDMWDDDTIDIKNFSRMDPGPSKDEFRRMLEERMNWYHRIGLYDWRDQIDVALWLDSEHPS